MLKSCNNAYRFTYFESNVVFPIKITLDQNSDIFYVVFTFQSNKTSTVVIKEFNSGFKWYFLLERSDYNKIRFL